MMDIEKKVAKALAEGMPEEAVNWSMEVQRRVFAAATGVDVDDLPDEVSVSPAEVGQVMDMALVIILDMRPEDMSIEEATKIMTARVRAIGQIVAAMQGMEGDLSAAQPRGRA